MNNKKVIIVGGGAAGFFTAINCAENNPTYEIVILEKSKDVLGKVKVSGGGRCNVTHACFVPEELVNFYPRGHKELLGPFHQFMTGDTMEWFENRGVSLKIEADNRVFPQSNDSSSIVNCLIKQTKKHGIKVMTQVAVTAFNKRDARWAVETTQGKFYSDALVIATGGNSRAVWDNLKQLGHTIIDPIPSLFSFNTKDTRLRNLSGLVAENTAVKVLGGKQVENGPLLITHLGLSGPAILKLSSVAARELHEGGYKFTISVDWCCELSTHEIKQLFHQNRQEFPKKSVVNTPLKQIPKRLWISLVEHAGITEKHKWAEISNKLLTVLIALLKKREIVINGKSTNKEEFVTCGGIDLKEIDFTSFMSKEQSNLYIVGEVLNIDALTGGFNFQAAWTGGFIAGRSL